MIMLLMVSSLFLFGCGKNENNDSNKNNITYTEVLKLLKNDRNKADKFTGKLSRKVFKEYKDKFNSDKEFSILVKKLLDDYFKSDSDI